MTRTERIAETISKFNFGNYGMDDVDIALHEDPEAQEWVPALADAIVQALDTAFACAHCGGKVSSYWIASGSLYWHADRSECRAAALLVIGE